MENVDQQVQQMKMQQQEEARQAVQDFQTADAIFREMEEKLTTGRIITDLFTLGSDPASLQRNLAGFIEAMREKLAERNRAAGIVKTKLRMLVSIDAGKWRGQDAKADSAKVGNVSVNSVTRRSFDGKTLVDLVSKKGLLERLFSLEGIDERTSKTYKLVEQKYEIDYEGVKSWLLQNGLHDVFDGAYNEVETTPTVKGAKMLAFLGEEKKE